jgi:hypothetical protein
MWHFRHHLNDTFIPVKLLRAGMAAAVPVFVFLFWGHRRAALRVVAT